MMKLYLATGNEHKHKEIQSLLPDFEIHIPADDNLDFNPIENGNSFFENAMIKATALYKLTGKPVIADDSGLMVDALNGKPGIYSARYGDTDTVKLSDTQRYQYLLQKLGNTSQRNARFVCTFVVLLESHRYLAVQETLEGTIAEAASGTGGFGYDPVFYVPEYKTTVANLSDQIKNSISHRGKAVAAIATSLRENFL